MERCCLSCVDKWNTITLTVGWSVLFHFGNVRLVGTFSLQKKSRVDISGQATNAPHASGLVSGCTHGVCPVQGVFVWQSWSGLNAEQNAGFFPTVLSFGCHYIAGGWLRTRYILRVEMEVFIRADLLSILLRMSNQDRESALLTTHLMPIKTSKVLITVSAVLGSPFGEMWGCFFLFLCGYFVFFICLFVFKSFTMKCYTQFSEPALLKRLGAALVS